MLHIVVGGQAGSESKGRVTAFLAGQRPGAIVVRVGGPNAGHVVYDARGRRYALRQIPVGVIHPEVSQLVIAPGSEVDPLVLAHEIELLESEGHNVRERLWVSPHATILTEDHIKQEQASDLNSRLGSTAKGVGAARADRIWRTAPTVREFFNLHPPAWVREPDPKLLARASVISFRDLVIEGTQGYSLGLHTENYPFTTSGDCRAIDFLAQAGLSPWTAVRAGTMQIHVVTRPNPIRVAGNSGPLDGETSWDELGLPVERTTVTNKVRRVGQFNSRQVRMAMLANGYDPAAPTPQAVWLSPSMVDHLVPAIEGATRDNLDDYDPVAINDAVNAVVAIGRALELGRPISTFVDVVGTGPVSSLRFTDLLLAADND